MTDVPTPDLPPRDDHDGSTPERGDCGGRDADFEALVAEALLEAGLLEDGLLDEGLLDEGLTAEGPTTEAPTSGAPPSGAPPSGAPASEAMRPALRARVLAAFEEVAAEELLVEALEGGVEAEWLLHALAGPNSAGPKRAGQVGAGEGTPGLRPGLRAAALAAFDDAAEAPNVNPAALNPAAMNPIHPMALAGRASATASARTAGVREEPLRARRAAPLLRMRTWAAAAILVVGVGVALVVTGGDTEAEAGLQLRALSRAATAGAVQTSRVEPRYFAQLGHVFSPSEDELLKFSLAEDSMVVVGAGDSVRVAEPTLRGAHRSVGSGAILRLESGEAQLATVDHALPLEIDGIGLLVLEEGAAHVAVDAGDGSHAPAVALHAHSVARFYRADGSGSVSIVGPKRVLLAADGIKAFGAPAAAHFFDLRFFGGPLPETTTERLVSARLFSTRAGLTRRGRQDVRILRANATALGTASHVTLVWQPEAAVRDARALKVALRAPAGTQVRLLAAADASVEPADAARRSSLAEAVLALGTDQREPGVASVELALPQDWFDRLPGGRIELRVEVPPASASASRASTGNVVAWFDGISLVFGPVTNIPKASGRKGGRDG